MKKTISILGATGSVGSNVLKIINAKKSFFNINILSAHKNFKAICDQIKKFNPKIYLVSDKSTYLKVKNKFKRKKLIIVNNLDNLKFNFKYSDISVAAIPGIAGLSPTLKIITKSKKILIANKESIISAWPLINKIALKHKTKIVPVDSEHFSIMKILENQNIKDVKKIYLTASGGPFLKYRISKLKKVKPTQAIKHPKWKMGKKISIDSATLMNKMLEVIEASKLFSIKTNKIDIVIHPESLVHAIIEFNNGLYKFIYHETTMLIPLANAIFEKNFKMSDFIKPKINTKKSVFFKNLNFLKVDENRFPIIKLKKRVNEHVSTPIIINAANEILVDQFLNKKISFNSFYNYLLMVLNDRNYRKYAIKEPKNIKQIFQIDKWSRDTVYSKIKN